MATVSKTNIYNGKNYHIGHQSNQLTKFFDLHKDICFYFRVKSLVTEKETTHTNTTPSTLGLVGPLEIYDYKDQFCFAATDSTGTKYTYLPNDNKELYITIHYSKISSSSWRQTYYLGVSEIVSHTIGKPKMVLDKILLGKGQGDRYWEGLLYYLKIYVGKFEEFDQLILDSSINQLFGSQFLEVLQ